MNPAQPGESSTPELPRVAVIAHPERLHGSPWPFSPQERIGGLPVLERVLLTLHRAGVRRFVLVGFPSTRELEQLTQKDPRLAGQVELRGDSAAMSPAKLVAGLAQELGTPFLLVSGNQVFSPSIVEHIYQQGENGGADTAVLVQPACPEGNESAILTYVRKPSAVGAGSSVSHWIRDLQGAGQVELVPLPAEGYWQALTTEAVWAETEKKIDRSLYKSTDNALARLNRRISIPISRLLMPLGVTPNAVTLVTLLLSMVSGVAYAQGGYGWMVLGGFLAWFTSVLDGTDGEIARLTYRESDFGCWLEAVCDHLFYVIVFAGIAVGLYRTTGDFLYLYTGALFEFGAILSFWILAHQRKMTTQRDAASTYVVKWRKRLEANNGNFFYRFSLRYGELVRRSVVPYGLFFFALLGDMNFMLFLCTFAANVVWVLSLYINRVLRSDLVNANEMV